MSEEGDNGNEYVQEMDNVESDSVINGYPNALLAEDGVEEEEVDAPYVLPERDLEEIVDDQGHFKQIPATEKDSYPVRSDAHVKLSELQTGFSKRTGFSEPDVEDEETYYLIAEEYVKLLLEWLNEEDNEATETELAVDNSDLLERDTESMVRKHNIRQFTQTVTGEVWTQLMDWFGGGAEIKIKCKNGTTNVSGKLIRVVCHNDNSKFRRFYFSPSEVVLDVKEEICAVFGVDSTQARLHDFFKHKPYARIDKVSDMQMIIQRKQLLHNNLCFLELANEEGEYKIEYTARNYYTAGGTGVAGSYYNAYGAGYGSYGMVMNDSISGQPTLKGKVGLNNLGNTCYMNSTLQCLSNVPLLKEVFLSKSYEEDINEDNVLGYKGKVAKGFFNLMETMWSGTGSVVRPAGFRKAITDAKTDFRGYQQHDSQEFLSQLLDAMHEDLNRIKNKPITDKVESTGRPDEVVAAESLAAYKARNDSIISDLFTGLYKSTVTCPDDSCGNVSVTFDPYMIIPLPLQAGEKAYHVLQIVYIPLDPEESPQKVEVIVPKHGPAFLLREILKEKLGINQKNREEVAAEGENTQVDEEMIGKRDLLVNSISGGKLGKFPFDNKLSLSLLTQDVGLVCFETFDEKSFESGNFVPDEDWKRKFVHARCEEDLLEPIAEEAEEQERVSEQGEAVIDDDKSEGDVEVEEAILVKEPEEAEIKYPNLDDDDEENVLDEEDAEPVAEEKVEEKIIEEVAEEDKVEVGFSGCPFLKGDVWHGNYNFNEDKQIIRMEVVGVEKYDWAAYANFKAEIESKYEEPQSDAGLTEEDFGEREVFHVSIIADTKEQLYNYTMARRIVHSDFELKGLYITNPVVPALDVFEKGVARASVKAEKKVESEEKVSEQKSQGSEPKEQTVKPKASSKKQGAKTKSLRKKKSRVGIFNWGKKKNSKVVVEPQEKEEPLVPSKTDEIILKAKEEPKKVVKKKKSKIEAEEDKDRAIQRAANKLIPGQLEKPLIHGSFVFRPTENRNQVEIQQSRYFSSHNRYAQEDKSRDPIIMAGSIEKSFSYCWGRYKVDNGFTKGEFMLQKFESLNWNHKFGGALGAVKNWSKFPSTAVRDKRILVSVCHMTGMNYKSLSGVPESFLVPENITESELFDLLKIRFTSYIEREFKIGGEDRKNIDEETGEEYDVIERFIQRLKILRANNKFDIASRSYFNADPNLGVPLDSQADEPLKKDAEKVFWFVVDWGEEYPFLHGRPSSVFEKRSMEEKMTLKKALTLFSQTDKLSALNAWYCSKCKDHKEAYKQLQLWSLPKVLVIQFKRFSQEEGRVRADKLDISVEFPFEIDLTDFTLSSQVAGESLDADVDNTSQALGEYDYELVAVSSHVGGGLGSGHYVACAKNEESGLWYDFNDSSVSEIPEENKGRIVNPQAYVLFYVKKQDLAERQKFLEERREAAAQEEAAAEEEVIVEETVEEIPAEAVIVAEFAEDTLPGDLPTAVAAPAEESI